MKSLKDVVVSNKKYSPLSLKKLTGLDIVDIEVSVSMEFGMPTLQIYTIVLSDGTRLGCGGEHDMPYIESDDVISDDQLQALYDEEYGEEEYGED